MILSSLWWGASHVCTPVCFSTRPGRGLTRSRFGLARTLVERSNHLVGQDDGMLY